MLQVQAIDAEAFAWDRLGDLNKAVQKSIGVLNWIFPPHIVPIQLKILIPVGMPTAIVVMVKKLFEYALIPTVNMWCAQTLKVRKPMQTVAATITG